MPQLTAHFGLAEFLVSETAARRGIDMTPPPAVVASLTALAANVLEPVRAQFGPVIITSGYRPPKLNRAIGGSATSQHCLGEAADFRVPGHSNIEICRWMEKHLNYDQLIYEFGESGWVHVSWRAAYRNMELTARRVKGRTEYLRGIVP